MKRRSWKVWVAGIALVQLLVVGVDVVLLWPLPSEAERVAAMIHEGMERRQVVKLAGEAFVKWFEGASYHRYHDWLLEDGSRFSVVFERVGEEDVVRHVHNIKPATFVHPLTRLRRTLARAFPFLGE